MEAEIVIASSPTDAGISCWNLETGEELRRFKSCSTPPHGLTCIAGRFLASSQVRDSNHSSSGSIFYWFWNKPKVQVKISPAEPIGPLVSHSEGTYIVGGGISGDIYLWEVETGKLLKKWHAHYRAVTCLVFNDDQSLLISGAEDGCVRVWSLFLIFSDEKREEAGSLHGYSFHEHSLKVTDIKIGHGGCNAIIVSASEDRTCKVWGLSELKLLGNIVFPSTIDAIVLEPGEKVFYAGGRDGEIYIAGSCDTRSLRLRDHSKGCKAVTCLASSADGFRLVAGFEDGMIRVWNTRTWDSRVFRHTKGSVNNVLVIRQTQFIFCQTPKNSMDSSFKRCSLLLPPDPRPLKKYANSPEENAEVKVYLGPHNYSDQFLDSKYSSVQTMENHIKELEAKALFGPDYGGIQARLRDGSTEEYLESSIESMLNNSQVYIVSSWTIAENLPKSTKRLGSSVAAEVELERPKSEQYFQMIRRWESLCKEMLQFCVEEILDGSLADGANSKNQCSKKHKKTQIKCDEARNVKKNLRFGQKREKYGQLLSVKSVKKCEFY